MANGTITSIGLPGRIESIWIQRSPVIVQSGTDISGGVTPAKDKSNADIRVAARLSNPHQPVTIKAAPLP